MAGDWIKMRADLFTHPKVVRISSALKADTLRTVGGLMSAWCLFDAHSIDGRLDGYSSKTLDDHLRWQGFATAMRSVNWLLEDAEGLALPRFDTHNGESAKRRVQDADRKREVRKMSAAQPDEKRTREDKSREDKGKDTPTPVGAEAAAMLAAYHARLPNCQRIEVLNPKRKKRISEVCKLARTVCAGQAWEYDAAAFWTAYFAQCAQDPWMRGDLPNPKNPSWKQNLDVLIREDRFAGIMDRAIVAERGSAA